MIMRYMVPQNASKELCNVTRFVIPLLIIYGARMNILFIVKLMILMLIKRSYRPQHYVDY